MFLKKVALLLGVCILSASFSSNAQNVPEKAASNPWKVSVLTNLTLTLNNYSDNWSGGEFSAFSWGWQFNGTAERVVTNWLLNKNTLKLAFGQTAIQQKDSLGNKDWQSLKKSSDLVDLECLGQFTLKSYVNPFISVRAVTQFADMRIDEYTIYFNPLTLTESFGAIRELVKNNNVTWSARLGGAVRQSLERNKDVRDSLGIEETINDGGFEFVTDFKATSKDNRLSYLTQFKMFEALFSSSADQFEGTPKENDWRYPDVAWENTLGVTLAKYLMLNLYAQLLYDREIDRDVRLRETVGLALAFSFNN